LKTINYPKSIPITGTFAVEVSYDAAIHGVIDIGVYYSTSWAWITGCSRYVPPGSDTVPVLCTIKNILVTSGIFFQVKFKNSSNIVLITTGQSPTTAACNSSASAPADYFSNPPPAAGFNGITIPAGNPWPTTVPVTGLVGLTVSYTAIVNSHLTLNFQDSCAYNWFGGTYLPVPQGTGTVKIGAYINVDTTKIAAGCVLRAIVSIMPSTDCYLARSDNYNCAVGTITQPVAYSKNITIAASLQDSTATSDTNNAPPIWAWTILAVALAIIAITILFLIKRSRNSEAYSQLP